jgi:hypothetical protein
LFVNRAQYLRRNYCDLVLCGSFSPEFLPRSKISCSHGSHHRALLRFVRLCPFSFCRVEPATGPFPGCVFPRLILVLPSRISLLAASSRSRYWFCWALAGVWFSVQILLSLSRWSCRWTRFPVSPSLHLASRFFPPAVSTLLARSSRRVSHQASAPHQDSVCHSSSWCSV